MFQSLSRDSGRLNPPLHQDETVADHVSIPQSGFGAFEPLGPASGRAFPAAGFNPSVGIRGV